MHRVLSHCSKVAYFRCPACNYCDVVTHRFHDHMLQHPEVFGFLDDYWYSGQEPIFEFFRCWYSACVYYTNFLLRLLEHLSAVHGEPINSPFKYIESTFPPAWATPHVPPPLHSVARMYEGTKLIMKFYGEVDHVILFYYFPIPVTYSIRDDDSRVGTLVFRHHPSNALYKEKEDAVEVRTVRSQGIVQSVYSSPWHSIYMCYAPAVLPVGNYSLSPISRIQSGKVKINITLFVMHINSLLLVVGFFAEKPW